MDAREFILAHANPNYDPAKRREYYLRTRQLKGRESGSGKPPAQGRPQHGLTNSEKDRQRVEALQKKLERLKEIYQELLAQSKGRAGIEVSGSGSKTASKKSSSSGGGSSTKTTAKERREAAERSKEWREKNPQKKKSETADSVEAKLASIRKAIVKIRAEIAIAKRKQARRSQSSSATVTANPSASGR